MCTGETMFLFRVSRFVRSCTTFVHRELRPDCGSKVRFVIPHTLGLCTDECPNATRRKHQTRGKPIPARSTGVGDACLAHTSAQERRH